MTAPKLPDIAPSQSTKLAVRQPVKTIRYGGGHTLYLRHGTLKPEAKWAVHWAGLTAQEGQSLTQFFESMQGITAFAWTPPNTTSPSQFICMEWTTTPLQAGFMNLDAVLHRR